MAADRIAPTGVQEHFDPSDILVSKTDLKGRITYANRVFQQVAGYDEAKLYGRPHNMIRHPDMPRCVFKLLWDRIEAGREVFAYVKNMCANGNHYWVFAHVTPTYGAAEAVVGYHSTRRVVDQTKLPVIEGLYRELCAIENGATNAKDGMARSGARLTDILTEKGMDYDAFVFAL